MNTEKQVNQQFNRTIIMQFKSVILEIFKLIMIAINSAYAKNMTPAQVQNSLAAQLPKAWANALNNSNNEFYLPFCPDRVDANKCQALVLNKGLYTQCQKNKKKNSDYCSACDKAGCKHGTVEDRLNSFNDTGSLYAYTAPDGSKPKAYTTFLEPGVSQEEVNKYFGFEIPDEHFTYVEDGNITKKPKAIKNLIPATNFLGKPSYNEPDTLSEPESEIQHTVAVDSKKSKKKVTNKSTTPTPTPAPAPVPTFTGETTTLGKSKKSFKIFTLNNNTYYQDPNNIDTLYIKDGSNLIEAFTLENGVWVSS